LSPGFGRRRARQGAGHVVGFDHGTSASCIAATVDRGGPIVIANADVSPLIPSIVALSETAPGRVWLGDSARRHAANHPEATIYAVKRLIGRRFDDPEVKRHKIDAAYDVVAGPAGEAWVRAAGRAFSPEEISALILGGLKKTAEDQLGEAVSDAVVVVPANFDAAQRQATREAGRLAGLNVLRILNEPTAAMLAQGEEAEARGEERVVVYHLGGGTFDVSLFRVDGDEIEVVATGGDSFLGGEDFDQRIVSELADLYQGEGATDARATPAGRQRLREAAQAAKHVLSEVTATDLALPPLGSAPRRGRARTDTRRMVTLTRERIEELTKDLVYRTALACEAAMADAGWEPADVKRVLLTGGQTRMPHVRAQIAELFGEAGRLAAASPAPDQLVAIGAAALGASLRGLLPARKIVERSSVSVGVETAGGVFTRIIPRHTSLPASNAQIFSTVTDNQRQLTIHVLQGERELAADNKSLGHFRIGSIPPAPRGAPQIQVALEMNEDGLVGVSATNLETGQKQAVETAAPAPQGG
jgi:molecular chaperone DnaK